MVEGTTARRAAAEFFSGDCQDHQEDNLAGSIGAKLAIDSGSGTLAKDFTWKPATTEGWIKS